MATWDDVDRCAMAMPDAVAEMRRGLRAWTIGGRLFVWERPLRRSDLAALGDAAPEGPILGARVEHLIAKDALLAAEPDACFTTPHFDGHASVLVLLDRVTEDLLEEIVTEAWLVRAPKRAARAYLAARPPT